MGKVVAAITTSIDGYVTAGLADELSIVVAPVILGGGKPPSESFSQSLDLEHLAVSQSPFATYIDYRLRRS